jgi:hypothetical protein
VRGFLLAIAVLSLPAFAGGQSALPAEIRRTLDQHFSGWQFAQLDSFNSQRLKPGERPDWVSGDLDGRGKQDYVVQIVSPARPENWQQLVLAFIAEGQGFTRFAIDSAGKFHETYLRVNRRGTRGFDIETHGWFTYERDVLSILYNQTAGMDCPYVDGGFSCRISGD